MELTEKKNLRIKELLKTNLKLQDEITKLERELNNLKRKLKNYSSKPPEIDKNLKRGFNCIFKN
jgi:hypothetical protein